MKRIRLIIILIILSATMLNAQNADRPWLFGVSTNYADFNAVVLKFTDQLTDANWMGNHQVSQFKASRFLSKSFNFSVQFSYISLEVDKLNKIPLKTLMTTDKFSRLGGQFEYKLTNGNFLNENARLSPYVFLGFFGSTINEQTYLTQSTGVGLNIWLNSWLGLNFEGSHEYNLVFNNYLHYSAGLVFTLKSDREPASETKPETFDLCPIINRLKGLYDCPKSESDSTDQKQTAEPFNDSIPDLIPPKSSVSGEETSDSTKIEIPVESMVFTSQLIYFDISSAELSPDAKKALDNVVGFMRMNPQVKIAIYGHTDNSGEINFNQLLSEERANAVANYLFLQGITEEQLVAKGFGATIPLAYNTTPEGRALNRRAELKPISTYHLIVGSFQKKRNAQRLIEKFTQLGYDPIIIGQDANGHFRVAIASFKDKREAESELGKVKSLFKSDAWLLEE